MKTKHTAKSLATAVTLGLGMLSLATPAQAAIKRQQSGLDSEPDVIYLKNHVKKVIPLLVAKDTTVWATKKGGTRLGSLGAGAKLELLAMTDRAYRVKGRQGSKTLTGWVRPSDLASKDPKFVDNLKKLYERQMAIKQLIANKEVAIGMSLDEVELSIGKPTKKQQRIEKGGRKGKWEYVTYEDVKHYRRVQDALTGQVYRQYTHTTREETGKVVVEFEDDIVTALEQSEDSGRTGPRLISPPIFLNINL